MLAVAAILALALAACQSAPPPAPTQAPPKAAAAPTAAPAQATAKPQATQPAAAAPAKPAAPAAEQKLNVGIGALPKTLDPIADSGLSANAVYTLLYDSLVAMDDKGNLVPSLAESWKTLDEKTWQFKLRKGVKFHNGEPFNAEAARFSLDQARDAKTKSAWAPRFTPVDRVDVVDDYTINVVTKDPWALAANTSFLARVMPPKYAKEKGDAFGNAPVGTGPFKFKEWKQDNYVTVEANPDYWGGAPKLSTVTIRAYPEASTLVAAVEKGEIDVAYNVPPDDVKRLKDKGLNILSRNLGHSLVFPLRSTVEGPLTKKEVRQALNYAIDKQAILDKVLGGSGRVLDGQVPGPEAFGYNPNLKPYPYDPKKARELLAQAGYPNGFKIKLHGAVGRWIRDKEISEVVATQLADVGVQADLEILESAVWYDLYIKGTAGPIFMTANAWAPLMDAAQGMENFLSDSPRKITASSRYDALFRKQSVTSDAKEREKTLWELHEVTRDEAPMIFMFQLPGIYAIHQKVQGIDLTAYYAMKNLTGISIR